jgi:hypothetical protein
MYKLVFASMFVGAVIGGLGTLACVFNFLEEDK